VLAGFGFRTSNLAAGLPSVTRRLIMELIHPDQATEQRSTTMSTTGNETTTSEPGAESSSTVIDNIRGTHDALSVRRVFGDPVEADGVTIIAVARVSGGAGGGGGQGTGEKEAGSGFGTGFGIHARPVGVYAVRNGQVEWKPTVDVSRLAHGGQVLAGIVSVCVTLIVLRKLRR
jgi:uncharacterized spore protein YtfJ